MSIMNKQKRVLPAVAREKYFKKFCDFIGDGKKNRQQIRSKFIHMISGDSINEVIEFYKQEGKLVEDENNFISVLEK